MSIRGVTAELLAAAREHGASKEVRDLLGKAVEEMEPYGAAEDKRAYDVLMYVLGASTRKPRLPRDGGRVDRLGLLFHEPEHWTDWDHRLLDLWQQSWKENALTLWSHFQGQVRRRPRDDVFGALYAELREHGLGEAEILHGMLHPLSIATLEGRSRSMVGWVRDQGEPTSLARWLRDQLPRRYRALADICKKHGGSWIGFPLVLVQLAPDLFEKHADEFKFPGKDSELRRAMLVAALVRRAARRFGERALKLAATLTDPDLKLDAAWSLVGAFPDEASELARAALPRLRHGADRGRAIALLLQTRKAEALPYLEQLRDPSFSSWLDVLKVAEGVAGAAAVPAIVDCLLAPHERGSEYSGVTFPELIDELCDLLDRHDLGGERERIERAFAGEKSGRIRERIRRLVSGKSRLPPEPKPRAPTVTYDLDAYGEEVRAAASKAIRAARKRPKSVKHLKLATVPDGVRVTAVRLDEQETPLKLPGRRLGDPRPLVALLTRHGQPADRFEWKDLSEIPSSLVLIELIRAACKLGEELRAAGIPVEKIDVGDPDSSWFDADRLAEDTLEGSEKLLSRPVFLEELGRLFYATEERRRWFAELVGERGRSSR